MALGDRFSTNVAGDSVQVTVVLHTDIPDQNGWQESFQICRTDSGSYIVFQNHGFALTYPVSKEEALKVYSEQLAKEAF